MAKMVALGGRRLALVLGVLLAIAVLFVARQMAGQAVGGAVRAQDITGSWQGTLEYRGSYRYVVKIARADDGALKATLYALDWKQTLPVTAITQADSTLRFSVVVMSSSYEGKLSADGSSITGVWTVDKRPLPMVFSRATPDTAWNIPLPPRILLKPMADDANPSFEVATIKPSGPQADGLGGRTQGRRFQIKTPLLRI